MQATNRSPKPAWAALFLLLSCWQLAAQEADSTRGTIHFSGSVSVTNNGFSFIPTFSLGEPATIVDISVGNRLRFEPQFRYGLNGVPWSFIFIWRYDLIRSNRFTFRVGTHLPALNFATAEVIKDGKLEEVIQARRFFPVLELRPQWTVRENISLAVFYLYGRAAKELTIRNSHFLALQSDFSHIGLPGRFYLGLSPQLYYLKQDAEDGLYVAGGVELGRDGFPLTLSSLFNKSITTDIADTNFDWNISLIWSFGNDYTRQ